MLLWCVLTGRNVHDMQCEVQVHGIEMIILLPSFEFSY